MRRFNKNIDIDEKIIELKLTMKNTNSVRLYKIYSVVLKHFQGLKKRYRRNGIFTKTHREIYIKNYIDQKEFEIKYSPGKKRKLSKEQEAKLVDIITTYTPEKVGFKNKCNWTIIIVQEYIQKKFNVNMCYSIYF